MYYARWQDEELVSPASALGKLECRSSRSSKKGPFFHVWFSEQEKWKFRDFCFQKMRVTKAD